jgi:tetratricopeptide (TPR) repeat protein
MRKLLLSIAALSLSGCTPSVPPPPPAPAEISITSKSPEAVEHFKTARALSENLRVSEAAAEFSKALALDPDFVLARAYLGNVTPGAEGLKSLEEAASKAGGLPEAERLLIEATLANRRGENAKSLDLQKQLVAKIPTDWRAQFLLGQQFAGLQKHGDATDALKKASVLNPKAGAVFNSLGYESLRQGDVEGAITAFKRYAELEPGEPNPQDSYGEALIAGGKFGEAEAAFQKAASLSPQFWNAWEGIAYAKFFAGDWAGGQEALGKARAGTARPTDRNSVDEVAGFASLAQGKPADALKQFDAIAKAPDSGPGDALRGALDRALVLAETGKHKDALAEVSNALQAIEKAQLPEGVARGRRVQALSVRIIAEAKMGDAAAAAKTATAIEQEAAAASDDPFLQSTVHFAQGSLAAAKKDFAGAGAHFAQCSDLDSYCLFQQVLASDKAKDAAASKAARDRLLRIYVRDPVHLYVRAKVAPAAK